MFENVYEQAIVLWLRLEYHNEMGLTSGVGLGVILVWTGV
jgi:hypothetical protein